MKMRNPVRLLLAAISVLLSGSFLVPIAAEAGSGTRTFEGYQFTEAEFQTMQAGAERAQNGARALAEQGKSPEEIVNYFYNGIKVERRWQ